MEHKVSTLKDTQGGGGSTAGSIIELWKRYGSAIDNDLAKLYALGLQMFKVNPVASIAVDLKSEIVDQERYWARLSEDVKEDTEAVEKEGEY